MTGCDVCGSRKNDCFFAGDFRINEQLNLIVVHTLFMREHNRLAAALAASHVGGVYEDRLPLALPAVLTLGCVISVTPDSRAKPMGAPWRLQDFKVGPPRGWRTPHN